MNESGDKCSLCTKPMFDGDFALRYTQKYVDEEAYIAHTRVFENNAYEMVLDKKLDKLDAKGFKYVFHGYCKGMNAYKLVYLVTSNHEEQNYCIHGR